MKALVIDEPWIDLILAGEKIWEMRKTRCHLTGPIALIRKGSGHVVGTAILTGCRDAISDDVEYARAFRFHRVPKQFRKSGLAKGWRVPWVLEGARPLRKPIPYPHPAGAVIWVNLPLSVSAKLPKRRRRISS